MRALRSLIPGLVLAALLVGCVAKEPRHPAQVYWDSADLTAEMTDLVKKMRTLSAFQENREKLAILIRMSGDLSVEMDHVKPPSRAVQAWAGGRDGAARKRFAAAMRRLEPAVREAIEKMLEQERSRVRAQLRRPPKAAATS